MIKNYLKIALANIYKSKVYSLISISSLSVGMAVCILLQLYVTHELSYDRYNEKSDNIYRLCQDVHSYQAPGAARLLEDNLPEIINYARILPRDNITVQFENKRFKENKVAWVDAELFDIFMTLKDGDKMFSENWMGNWGWCNFLVYFEMQDNFSKPDLDAKISQILTSVDKHNAPTTSFTIQNVVDVHLYSLHFLGLWNKV